MKKIIFIVLIICFLLIGIGSAQYAMGYWSNYGYPGAAGGFRWLGKIGFKRAGVSGTGQQAGE